MLGMHKSGVPTLGESKKDEVAHVLIGTRLEVVEQDAFMRRPRSKITNRGKVTLKQRSSLKAS
jgi:hypothetical protein